MKLESIGWECETSIDRSGRIYVPAEMWANSCGDKVAYIKFGNGFMDIIPESYYERISQHYHNLPLDSSEREEFFSSQRRVKINAPRRFVIKKDIMARLGVKVGQQVILQGVGDAVRVRKK